LKPDGAKWISYRMPDDWPHRRVVRVPRSNKAPRTPTPGEGPKIAHYLCFSLQCRVPIPLKFAVPLSEKFRAAANFHLCKTHGDGTPSFALFGHEKPVDVTSDHQHAFYLPMSRRSADKDDPENREDQDRFLRYLHIWCPYGFTQAEVEILMRVQRLDWGSGRYPLRPVLVALSKDPPPDIPFSTGRTAARLWRSVTPFVPPRYFYRGSGTKVKAKERDRPELQLAECLKAAGVTTPGEIRRHPLADGAMQGDKPLWDVVRAEIGEQSASGSPLVTVPTHRNGSSGRRGMEQRIGLFLEIEFEQPVALPFPALGHSCHFGLGVFIPAD
jgi:CRISPR-associated protein Csb2